MSVHVVYSLCYLYDLHARQKKRKKRIKTKRKYKNKENNNAELGITFSPNLIEN